MEMFDLFEWLGESLAPGPVGSVGGYDNARSRTRGEVLATGLFALIVALVPVFLVYMNDGGAAAEFWAMLFTTVYISAGYLLDPRPNLDNVGWLWGAVNNPFRVSDDVNRLLLMLKLLLYPGRMAGIGLVDFLRLLDPALGRRRNQRRPPQTGDGASTATPAGWRSRRRPEEAER